MMTVLEQVDRLADLGLNHPTRLRIALHLAEHNVASPVEITRALGAGHSLGAVAYHVRTLVADGVLVLARESRVRGAVEHHYRLSPQARRLLKRVVA